MWCRHLAIALALAALPAAAATPTLVGSYRLGGLGIVDFSTSGGQIIATLKVAEECPDISPESQVLTEGAFEGSVFTGTVLLCQSGPRCKAPQRRYPFLGFWIEGQLVGSVRLDDGCTSPAVDRDRMLVTKLRADEEGQIPGARPSAAGIADPGALEMEKAIEEAARALGAGKYAVALRRLKPWDADARDNTSLLLVRGVSRTMVTPGRQVERGLEDLRRAATLTRERRMDKRTAGKAHLELAKALVRARQPAEAVTALSDGYDYAGTAGYDAATLSSMPEFQALQHEVDFKALVARMRVGARDDQR